MLRFGESVACWGRRACYGPNFSCTICHGGMFQSEDEVATDRLIAIDRLTRQLQDHLRANDHPVSQDPWRQLADLLGDRRTGGLPLPAGDEAPAQDDPPADAK